MSGDVSQKRIAAMAGVDQSAVSHALRGTGTLKSATRQRILAICKRLNYRPNAHAQSLRTARSGLIGVITGRIEEAFHAQLIDALTRRLMAHDYHVMLRYCDREIDLPTRRRQILSLLDRQAEGIVVATYSPTLQREVRQLIEAGIPLVSLGFNPGMGCGVACDRTEGGRMAARHLLEVGCRRIATVFSPGQNIEGSIHKKAGVDEVLRQAGHRSAMNLPFDRTCHPQLAGHQAVQALWRAGRRLPDGLICDSDDLAIGASRALLDRGVRIGGDVAVMGYDDTPQAAMAAIPLSTIRQPIQAMTHRAVELLLQRLTPPPPASADGPGPTLPSQPQPPDPHDQIERMPMALIVRASTARH